MSDPRFLEPEWDLSCDESGFPWDEQGADDNLGNYDDEGDDDG